ncbi:heavy metal response regulator transcription factor [Aliiglaciecola sp. CAU 1673]|uniref:heavy metal response regulator transcription factor n=1 Tax=Aliiglaciecola sp. CAU 1673 TaxID=3032595 RepID=UPI0023DBD75C|nr:heavy metal response regulator transcription factor [Aliiglaciecola sp. CAU 1673]MDF2179877.1 heavy metal response regulator transcription factor [Aliiglaciecola sp. CAU 1673]
MRLLVIEDEVKIGDYLKKGLEEAGFLVQLCRNGLDGYHFAASEVFDLVILDVMLPDINGWQILKRIREKDADVPVMFLTARDRLEDKINGLEAGADDYLVKPFAFAELLARVRTLLRRGAKQSQPDRLEIEDLMLDLPKHKAFRHQQRLNLTNKEFALLELLARHRGEVLTRSSIASQVWDMNFDSDTNVIDVAIRRLRAKVDDPYELKLIHTVRGVGYKLDVEA